MPKGGRKVGGGKDQGPATEVTHLRLNQPPVFPLHTHSHTHTHPHTHARTHTHAGDPYYILMPVKLNGIIQRLKLGDPYW